MPSFPITLPLPIQGQYSIIREITDTYLMPRSGTRFVFGESSQEGNYFTVSWSFTQAQYDVFSDWFYDTLNAGEKAFTMPLRIEAGTYEQECFFVSGSVAGYEASNGNYNVSGQIFVGKLNDPEDGEYETLLYMDNLGALWVSVLDKATNGELS